jgi:serine/threonine protein kinase
VNKEKENKNKNGKTVGTAATVAAAATTLENKRIRKRTKSNGESLIVLYIQMRLCDFTLRHWMNNRNQEYFNSAEATDTHLEIDEAMCMNIFRQIVSGVEYIHSKSIIHRDLKVGDQNLYCCIT